MPGPGVLGKRDRPGASYREQSTGPRVKGCFVGDGSGRPVGLCPTIAGRCVGGYSSRIVLTFEEGWITVSGSGCVPYPLDVWH